MNAELLSRPSATETLTDWCADHHLATDPRIVAVRQPDVNKPPDAAILALLGGAPADGVKYRRVDLKCGVRVLSRADNWFRPDRLTPAMNAALENTRTPFGVVVRPLGFTRRTIEVTLGALTGRHAREPFVLRHRAVLFTRDGTPFSVVEESYTPEVLAGSPRRAELR